MDTAIFSIQTPVTATSVTVHQADADNPLIDRISQDDWRDLLNNKTSNNTVSLFADCLFAKPKILVSFEHFEIADFSDFSMDDDIADDLDDNLNAHTSISNTLYDNTTQASTPVINTAQNTIPNPVSKDNQESAQDNLQNTTEKTQQKSTNINQTINQNQPTKPTTKKPKTPSKFKQLKQEHQARRQKAQADAQIQAEKEANRQAKIAESLANPTIHQSLINQRKSMVDDKPVAKDSFSELEQDLQVAILPEHLSPTIKNAYNQAIKILQTPNVEANHSKALALVDKLAKANVTDAMLHQALWYLRGRDDIGFAQNIKQGLLIVQKSAQLQDCRAEKLLSKLYFSGEFVGVSRERGEYWLKQSALHGHVEAKKLQNAFEIANSLKQTRMDDDDYMKKMALGVGALLVFTVVVIFAVKI